MKKSLLLLTSLFTLIAATALAAETSVQSVSPPAEKAEGPHSSAPAHAVTPRNVEPISGTVLETMNSGGYSYIYLQKMNGDKIWVAVTETAVEVGSRMGFNPGMVMSNFESKGLKRTFGSIIFTDGSIRMSASDSSAASNKKQATSSGSKGATVGKDAKISVAKAVGPNSITVEEAFVNGASLDKKNIVVRGKVVKVSTGIMKKNWIHIQDGSGSQEKGTYNLVCTTQDKVEAGAVVTVSGILMKERDFGGGYKYNVIIEDARIKN